MMQRRPLILAMASFALLSFSATHGLFAEAKPSLPSPDPAKGYSFLVNEGYIGCGVPYDLMKRAYASAGLIPKPILGTFLPLVAEEVFTGETLLPGRTGDNQNITPVMNVFTTKRGTKAMNYNCLSCHGEYLNGSFVVGLGNRTRDYTEDLSRFTKLLPMVAINDEEREELAVFSRGINTIAPYVKAKTIGSNPAVNLTYALFAKRNHDFTWSSDFTLDPPAVDFPPVDVPPWWRMGQKSTMFYNGEFEDNHHRVMALASTLCIENAEEMRAWDEPFRDVEAFIKNLKAPVYPRPVDHSLVREGEAIFNQNCSSCHGSYGENGVYSETFVPIEVVGTDPKLMEQQYDGNARFVDWFQKALYVTFGATTTHTARQGYLAPPLHGIWATAPFFHNGSVPTLEGVLNSEIRPTFWRKDSIGDGFDYDLNQIGVKHTVLEWGQAFAFPFTRRYIYDTSLPGYGNQGHTFGDDLSDNERRAVIEYLKTL